MWMHRKTGSNKGGLIATLQQQNRTELNEERLPCRGLSTLLLALREWSLHRPASWPSPVSQRGPGGRCVSTAEPIKRVWIFISKTLAMSITSFGDANGCATMYLLRQFIVYISQYRYMPGVGSFKTVSSIHWHRSYTNWSYQVLMITCSCQDEFFWINITYCSIFVGGPMILMASFRLSSNM